MTQLDRNNTLSALVAAFFGLPANLCNLKAPAISPQSIGFAQNSDTITEIKGLKKAHGFSLIELMIVVVIAGILAAVAANFYGDNVTAANRSDARSVLTTVAGSLEKCKATYGRYDNANCNVAFPITSDNELYSVTSAIAGTTFTLTATPVAGKRQSSDADCTAFTLTNTGMKGSTGADTSVCW
jgi:type IV pilus assembly protein PilE